MEELLEVAVQPRLLVVGRRVARFEDRRFALRDCHANYQIGVSFWLRRQTVGPLADRTAGLVLPAC